MIERIVLSLELLERLDPDAPPPERVHRHFLCPNCATRKPHLAKVRSLSVHIDKGEFVCGNCNQTGMLSEWHFESPQSVSGKMKRKIIPKTFLVNSRPVIETEVDKEWRRRLNSASGIDGTPGASFITDRQLNIDLAESCGVRFSPDWYGRPALLFPMLNPGGDVVAVAAQYCDNENPKGSLSGHKSAGVFWTANAVYAKCLAVTEGPYDALALFSAGIAATALVGTTWPDWFPALCSLRRVLLATSASGAGDNCAARLKFKITSNCLRLRPRGAKTWADLIQRGKLPLSVMRGFAVEPRLVIDASGDANAPSLVSDDEVRVDCALQLARAGRLEAALFVASLIDNYNISCETINGLNGSK